MPDFNGDIAKKIILKKIIQNDWLKKVSFWKPPILNIFSPKFQGLVLGRLSFFEFFWFILDIFSKKKCFIPIESSICIKPNVTPLFDPNQTLWRPVYFKVQNNTPWLFDNFDISRCFSYIFPMLKWVLFI